MDEGRRRKPGQSGSWEEQLFKGMGEGKRNTSSGPSRKKHSNPEQQQRSTAQQARQRDGETDGRDEGDKGLDRDKTKYLG